MNKTYYKITVFQNKKELFVTEPITTKEKMLFLNTLFMIRFPGEAKYEILVSRAECSYINSEEEVGHD